MPSDPEERSSLLLDSIKQWLHFAELKNGALLTINLGTIIGVHQIVDWYKLENFWLLAWAWSVTIFLLASAIVALSSFYARTNVFGFEFFLSYKQDGTNVHFFGDIANMSKAELRAKIYGEQNAGKEDAWVLDMIDQIIINSKITKKKSARFNLALALTLAGILTPAGWLAFYYGLCDEKI